MSRVRIKWNRDAFRAIRTSPEVAGELAARGQRIADAAGPGYLAESGITGGRGRARTAVFTSDGQSIRDNAENQTLLRSLDAGRG